MDDKDDKAFCRNFIFPTYTLFFIFTIIGGLNNDNKVIQNGGSGAQLILLVTMILKTMLIMYRKLKDKEKVEKVILISKKAKRKQDYEFV